MQALLKALIENLMPCFQPEHSAVFIINFQD